MIIVWLCESYDQSVFAKAFSLSFSHSSSTDKWYIFTPVLKMRLLGHHSCPGTCRKWFFPFLWRAKIWCAFHLIPFHLFALTLTGRSDLRRTNHMPRTSFSEYRAKMFRRLKWYKEFWFSWGLGQQVCLLRCKRICFACAGDLDSTLFLFTRGGRQLYRWNVSLNHRVLEHMKLECGNCYCLQ